jgi:hypothetical protein
MLALAVLKKGLPGIRGVLVTSMSRTTSSTGTKNVLWIFDQRVGKLDCHRCRRNSQIS